MILFAGDPHGSFDHLYPFLTPDENGQKPALVILGDLHITHPDELNPIAERCDLWFIHGNHDTKTASVYDALMGSHWQERNLHGKVQEIQGVRIAGLGGIFRGKIWMPPAPPHYVDPIHLCQYCNEEQLWRRGTPLRHRSSIFPADIDGLRQQKADILITHEAPRPHPYGFRVLNDLARDLGVKRLFHGHHHDNFCYDKWAKSYPFAITNVGFRSIADIKGNYLLKTIDDRH